MRVPASARRAASITSATLVMLWGAAVHGQNITCTARMCSGTDIMGNPVLLQVHSDRLDPNQSYTAIVGDNVIEVTRKRSPMVTADSNGPALMQRPITVINGQMDGHPVHLHTESSGLTTGEIFGDPVTCAVNGWSMFRPSACF